MTLLDKWPVWLPYIGPTSLSADDAVEVGLPRADDWRGFVVAWLGFGMTIAAWRKGR